MFAARGALYVQPVRASVLLCLATPAALDSIACPSGTAVLRVAADEVLLLGPPGGERRLADSAGASLATLDRHSLAMAMTDAWAAWSLRQPGALAALARLTAVPVPGPGPSMNFVQGAVCGIAAKMLVLPARVCVLVSSSLTHHLRDRVMQLCADMNPTVETAWDFDAPATDRPPELGQ